MGTKSQSIWQLLYKKWLYKYSKSYGRLNEIWHRTDSKHKKTAEGEKTSFPKEALENAHFYKPALINLKTTQK